MEINQLKDKIDELIKKYPNISKLRVIGPGDTIGIIEWIEYDDGQMLMSGEPEITIFVEHI